MSSVTFRTTTKKTPKPKDFFYGALRFYIKTSSRKTDSKSSLFQVSLGESKPADEDVTPSSSSQRFLQRVSIPVWVGHVSCCVEGKFQKTRVHGSDPQSLGAALSNLQLVGPLKSTDCVHSMAGLSWQCTVLQCLDYLHSSNLLLYF